MKKIAIITARGGSKRIPKKNIKDFLGKPIICYSIEAALNSKIFDEVMVSTDSDEISEIAKQAGAKVPFMRSDNTSNDYATTADVLLEVLQKYEELGFCFDYACCIYPTAPFVTSQKLRDAMNILIDSDATDVMPVTEFSFPPQRSVFIRDGNVIPVYPEYQQCRSQDLEPIYHDAGQFYCLDVSTFMPKSDQLPERKIKPIIVSELEVQDIDNFSDWEIAEMKYELMKKRENTAENAVKTAEFI